MKLALVGYILASVQGEYDYIVVGSGTGGGTVAAELANSGFYTLLIEAGPERLSPYSTTPAFNAIASEDRDISFGFDVKHFTSGTLADKTYFYPRVGALGGCSIHNTMIALYPVESDFTAMVEATGDSGFNEENMRTYFTRMENNHYVLQPQMPKEHGYRGWFDISYVDITRIFRMDLVLIDLFRVVVGNPMRDVNTRRIMSNKLNTGLEGRINVPQAVDTRNYERSNFVGFINAARSTGNLVIWADTFVTKLILENNTVSGVEYRKGKYLYKASPRSTSNPTYTAGSVTAKKEVIVSGGAFNTPQLLMLSGIGDPAHLREMGIKPKVNLPGVGRGLMDRYEVPVVIEFSRNISLLEPCTFTADAKLDPCYREYKESQSGPYISNGLVSGEIHRSSPSVPEPDLFILNTLSGFHGYFRGYSNDIVRHSNRFSQIILKALTNHTGFVKLKSKDPFATPEINFNSFSNGDADLDILVQAIRRSRNYLNSIVEGHKEIYPGPHLTSDDQLRKFVKEIAWGHHACCTAKIGQGRMAVLDGRFRVRNVRGLRVVDASAFPEIPGFFPSLYLHMLAMRAADLIAQDSKHF
ncbi:hypothetical protein DSO57_1021959 [Entomophthora muscae]|uniref:Uncharacterized protein n=1 Tax=Entomophthora muscae TaxID=34485 RepID=A0ACC2RUE0_9FUNG|nr:hypothetical protein DSO57_1021959 [Entomophthora muscae]